MDKSEIEKLDTPTLVKERDAHLKIDKLFRSEDETWELYDIQDELQKRRKAIAHKYLRDGYMPYNMRVTKECEIIFDDPNDRVPRWRPAEKTSENPSSQDQSNRALWAVVGWMWFHRH